MTSVLNGKGKQHSHFHDLQQAMTKQTAKSQGAYLVLVL